MTFTIEVVQVVCGFPEFGHVKFILMYYYGKMSLWKMVTMENDMPMYHYGKCHYGKRRGASIVIEFYKSRTI